MQLRTPLLASLVLIAFAWSASAQARSTSEVAPSTPRGSQRALVVPKPAPRRIQARDEKKPVTFGSVERTKLLAQGRGAKDAQLYGSVARRAALNGQRVQVPRKPAQHRRR